MSEKGILRKNTLGDFSKNEKRIFFSYSSEIAEKDQILEFLKLHKIEKGGRENESNWVFPTHHFFSSINFEGSPLPVF